MLADSELKNDRRMLQEYWQTDALLLPDELIARQNDVRTFVEHSATAGMPKVECNHIPELQLRVHSAPSFQHIRQVRAKVP